MNSLAASQIMKPLVDKADIEQRGGIQKRTNLQDYLRRQPGQTRSSAVFCMMKDYNGMQ